MHVPRKHEAQLNKAYRILCKRQNPTDTKTKMTAGFSELARSKGSMSNMFA